MWNVAHLRETINAASSSAWSVDNIRMGYKEIRSEDVDWICLA